MTDHDAYCTQCGPHHDSGDGTCERHGKMIRPVSRVMRTETVKIGSTRLDDHDRESIRSRVCAHMTAYGLPWAEYCGKPLTDAEVRDGHLDCQEHENQTIENYPDSAIVRLETTK